MKTMKTLPQKNSIQSVFMAESFYQNVVASEKFSGKYRVE
jgi:hypothetical protein